MKIIKCGNLGNPRIKVATLQGTSLNFLWIDIFQAIRPSVSLPQGPIVRRHPGEVEGHIHAARPVAPGGRQNGDQTSERWVDGYGKGPNKGPWKSANIFGHVR